MTKVVDFGAFDLSLVSGQCSESPDRTLALMGDMALRFNGIAGRLDTKVSRSLCARSASPGAGDPGPEVVWDENIQRTPRRG